MTTKDSEDNVQIHSGHNGSPMGNAKREKRRWTPPTLMILNTDHTCGPGARARSDGVYPAS
jgi:hypothetical protein